MALRIRKVPLWETPTAIALGAAERRCVDIRNFIGDAMVLEIILTDAGAGDDVDFTMEVSDKMLANDVAGKVPYDSSGSMATIELTVVASKWLQFTPALTPYLIIKADADDDSTLEAYLYIQEDV